MFTVGSKILPVCGFSFHPGIYSTFQSMLFFGASMELPPYDPGSKKGGGHRTQGSPKEPGLRHQYCRVVRSCGGRHLRTRPRRRCPPPPSYGGVISCLWYRSPHTRLLSVYDLHVIHHFHTFFGNYCMIYDSSAVCELCDRIDKALVAR